MTQLDWIEQVQQRVAKARDDLQRIVERERNSFACEDYRRRRAAALKSRLA